MPSLCLFCNSDSGSKEHLWPKWIHERKDFGALRIQLGNSEQKIIPNPEIMVKTVCGGCNNGWMSSLESENVPIIGRMVQDIAVSLDGHQQKLVAAWSIKTAMVSDSMKGRNAPNQFYSREECSNMRIGREIPARTLIWIGRIDRMHLGNFGTDFALFDPQKIRIGMGSVNTSVAGHFVTQVVTVHIEKPNIEISGLACKMGNWNKSLLQIWPPQKSIVRWPPKISFANGGGEGIAYLLDRWRIGDAVEKVLPLSPSV